jgi:hypothetical protein
VVIRVSSEHWRFQAVSAMNRLVALNSIAHRDVRVDTQKVLAEGARLHMVPVGLSEFLKLCVQYPIVLTKNGETGQFVCVALFGFAKHENLFWKDGRWDAIYTPLQITRQPFFLGSAEGGSGSAGEQGPLVCIDMSSTGTQGGNGEAIFDEQGNETTYLQQAKQALAVLLADEAPTARLVSKLLALDLVQGMRLEIELANRESMRVEGLYTIAEPRLKALPREALIELHSLDYLAPIYTMIASLGHIYSLVQRKNALLAAG